MHFKITSQIRCILVSFHLWMKIQITISIFDEFIHSIVHVVDHHCCDDRNFSAFTHTTSYLIRRYKTHSKHQFESWYQEYLFILQLIFSNVSNNFEVWSSSKTMSKNHSVHNKSAVQKYGIVISNCVDRCELTYFLLCTQAYFHTNMPIICHKRPRKST